MSAGSLPVYRGRFGKAQAERLLWRAGFGPKPGQAGQLARLGVRGAVLSLTRPRSRRLVGPAPVLENGQPIAPYDAWGNDVLWWLDRMVRTDAPLIERMTLIWHDWFATSNETVNSQRLMIAQNRRSGSSAWELPADAEGDDDRPGDADLAVRGWQHQGGAERELRARDAGAVHPGGRQRLHRARRPRTRAGADGLDQHLEQRDRAGRRLPVRAEAPRRRRQGHLRPARALRLDGQHRPGPGPPRPSGPLRHETLVLLLPRAAAGSRPARCGTALSRPAASRSGRSSRRC